MAASVFLVAAAQGVGQDIGLRFENQLRAESNALFGVGKPLEEEFTGNVARAAGQDGSDLVALASGLEATILTRNIADLGDMMAFWPNDENPEWIIACIEGVRTDIDPGAAVKWNPGVQRISIDGSTVQTILRGTTRCDGIRRTPWGSILATEEDSTGAAWEIIDPPNVTNYIITDRAAGTITDAVGGAQTKVAKRTALPIMAWEGLAVLPSGVVIAGDELRPGDSGFDTDGGAIFKFVPTTLRTGSGTISSLTQSPLTAGTVWAMQVSANDNNGNTGQGAEVGNAAWVSVTAATARTTARAAGATALLPPRGPASGHGVCRHRRPRLLDRDGQLRSEKLRRGDVRGRLDAELCGAHGSECRCEPLAAGRPAVQ